MFWILLLNVLHPTCERVEYDWAREAQPLAGGSVLQDRWNWALEGYFKLEQVGDVGVGLIYLFGSQEGHLKRMRGSDMLPWLEGSEDLWKVRRGRSENWLEKSVVINLHLTVGKGSRDWGWYEVALPRSVRLECPLVTDPQGSQILLLADLLLLCFVAF